MMANDMKKRLFDMKIDEVSLVDRPANQHATMVFSKADDTAVLDDVVELEQVFDDDGNEIDLDTLEPGAEVVIDGETYEIIDDEDTDDSEGEYSEVEPDDSDDGEEVGKTFMSGLTNAAKFGRHAGKAPGKKKEVFDQVATGPGSKLTTPQKAAYKTGKFIQERPGTSTVLGAGAASVPVGAYAYQKSDKGEGMSYTDEVLEELSKAVGDHEREQVFAKMASDVEALQAAAEEAIAKANAAEERELEMAFISKAAEYNLPVAPDAFGPILMKMATVLDESEFELIDKVFSAVGDALYDEIGYVGGGDNGSVLDTVDSLADELVGKSEGQFSKAEAQVALMAANPDSYDAYLAEQNR